MRILVVEDDIHLAGLIKRTLEEEGYAVDTAGSGEEGEVLAGRYPYDIIVLDVMLPGKDGFTVCQEIREARIKCPVLMLTCRGGVEDKVKGLRSGADDYLTKPFDFRELIARIQALLRREPQITNDKLTAGNLAMDTQSHKVWLGEQQINLNNKEYALLEMFMRHPNAVLSRSALEEHVWDDKLDSTSNVVDVYIAHLRHKIGDKRIQTVPKSGYRLDLP